MSKYIKPKAGINVSGMSLNDILNMDYDTVERLSRNDLARITSRLASAGNKRIRTLRKSAVGHASQALKGLDANGRTKFSVKGKSHGKLLKEFANVKSFLKSKTSTVAGTKAVIKKTNKTLKEKYGINVNNYSKSTISHMWDMFHKLQEKGSIGGRGSLSSELASKVMGRLNSETFDSMSENEFEEYINNGLEGIYEEDEIEDNYDYDDEFEDVEDFF